MIKKNGPKFPNSENTSLDTENVIRFMKEEVENNYVKEMNKEKGPDDVRSNVLQLREEPSPYRKGTLK